MDPNVTQEEKDKARQICFENLDGAWKEVPLNEVKICKLSGGMSNLLYYCALPERTEIHNDEPRQVLLRLYGPFYSDTELQLEIFNQLSKENLGPKLYRTFKEGRLEEYLESSPLSWAQVTDEQVSAVVARKMAAIHKLTVKSLPRESNWLIDKYNKLINFLSVKCKNTPPFNENTLNSTRILADELRSVDFKPEVEYVTSLLLGSKAPLVFSHNDLHQNNILLMHDSDIDPFDRIVLIDFEYCSYNFRTFDAANHLSEWCFDYNGDKYPHFNASLERFPSEERQRQFLRHYVDQYNDTNKHSNGGQRSNYSDDVNTLFVEMQPFLMASNLLWAMWAVQSAYTSEIQFGYWEMAKYKWEIYLLCKRNYKLKLTIDRGCDGDFKMDSKM